ncbi:MAG: hypothetical protein B0D92_06135 [Spirochaeta sp. LUC14_002_19_P3]|nr:MAG: hypothetical protein B0D92_06135 [Spirochaeta sp. LUC14_002_19_P3]
MTGKNKAEIITFKVDETLMEAMAGITNRSDFIRGAILSALGNCCPLCGGTGTLSSSRREHWDDFTRHHRLATCADCREPHLVCDHEEV